MTLIALPTGETGYESIEAVETSFWRLVLDARMPWIALAFGLGVACGVLIA